MITSLHIHGFDIVPDIALQFDRGMYAITGETGSGKSVLIGALQSLSDSSRRPGNVAPTKQKAFVEAHFQASLQTIPKAVFEAAFWEHESAHDSTGTVECIIRREFSPSGRSRVFINDSPSTAEIIQQLCDVLFDVHGQHDTQLLVRSSEQLQLIDRFVDASTLSAYKSAYSDASRLHVKMQTLLSERTTLAQAHEFKAFQLEEIQRVDPQVDEYEELESSIRKAESIERITGATQQVIESLVEGDNSGVVAVQEAIQSLNELINYFPELEETRTELHSVQVILEEAARTCRALDVEQVSSFELDSMRQRYVELRGLFKKHGGEIATLQLYEQLQEEINDSASIDERIQYAESQFNKARQHAIKRATALHKERERVATTFASSVTDIIRELGMPTAMFVVDISKRPTGETGIDFTHNGETFTLGPNGYSAVAFRFASSKGAEELSLKTAASGGEISRVMLAIKAIEAKVYQTPLMVFDEIDTGISGKVAAQTGRLLKNVARDNQILLITHLPQIAAAADCAISVEKSESGDNAFSISASVLGSEARIYEIAKLMSAETVTDETLESAQQLVQQYRELVEG